jgi:hypothetical protein
MALSSRRRKALPKSKFAYPRQRKYPIDTVKRARNALARAAQAHTSGTYQHVARAVRKRWGNRVATVGPTRGTVSAPGYRRGGRRRRKAARARRRTRTGRFTARRRRAVRPRQRTRTGRFTARRRSARRARPSRAFRSSRSRARAFGL